MTSSNRRERRKRYETPEFREHVQSSGEAWREFNRPVLLGNAGGLGALLVLTGADLPLQVVQFQGTAPALLTGVAAIGMNRYAISHQRHGQAVLSHRLPARAHQGKAALRSSRSPLVFGAMGGSLSFHL